MGDVAAGHQWQQSAGARGVHAAVALLSFSGLASSLYLGWTNATELPPDAGFRGGFAAGWEHMLNQPSYFTFLSAALVCVTSALLALRPGLQARGFHTARLSGVVCVVITGIVFNLLLRTEGELVGLWLFNDTVLHLLVPIVAPLVWLILGPHGALDGRTVTLSMVIPVLWLVVTLLRGPGLDWYPYIILDVPRMGYGGVSVYIGAILVVYLVIACALWQVDRLVAPQRTPRA